MEERDTIILTQDEQERLRVLEQLRAGNVTIEHAATVLELSPRQVFRLQSRYASRGVAGLVHGNRGRPAQNRVTQEERVRIVALSQDRYEGLNHSHLRDLLAEREGIEASTPTLTRILREASTVPARRQQRRSTHRLRRDRMPQEGMLVQVDGSLHHWFGEDRPRVCLLAAIDDATSTVIAAVFREHEGAQGYLLLLEQIIRHYGCHWSSTTTATASSNRINRGSGQLRRGCAVALIPPR